MTSTSGTAPQRPHRREEVSLDSRRAILGAVISAWPMLVSLLVIAAVLSGCAFFKPPTHEQIVSRALPPGTTIPPEWTTGGSRKDVGDNWLKTFRDPGLDAVVTEGIRNNLDLRAAAARVQEARETVVVVGSQLWPQVGIDLGGATTHDEGGERWFNSSKGLLGVAWEPDIWGKLRAQREASEAGSDAVALEFAFGRQSLAAMIGRSWYLNIEAVQLLEIAGESVELYSKLLDLVKVRRDAGKVTDLDVAEASANLNASESVLLEVQGLVSEARRSLEVLLGRYPSAQMKVARNFTGMPPPVRAGLPSSLLERRPDLIAAERRVLEAFRSEEAAKLALLPSFSLNLNAGKLSDNLLSLLRLNPWMLHSTVGMSVPIDTGGALRAQVRIATAQQQQAVAQYGAAALTAFREVENGLMNERLLAQRLEFDQKVLNNRTEAVQIARIKFDAGAIDLLSLLQLQGEQIASQVQVVKMRYARFTNRIDLHLALGGSFDAPARPPAKARP